ncbi:hypothetical protein [Sphaerisporangium fuscum]|uniref:hypothetical protein n=1 Tax=Sphaerisporangium fuscum TaxID=2835868 RepID=UPI001BDCF449|nr:hypothetical protein [Sphaerisporangium fuscum]
MRVGERTLSALDLSGDAGEAMTRLLASSWKLVAESAALLTAAEDVLPAGRVRELHDQPAQRMADLVRRGQRQGVFRTDLPSDWLVSVAHYILHGAADQVRAGRLAPQEAADMVTETVRSVLTGRVRNRRPSTVER